jgi:hypothetical protein
VIVFERHFSHRCNHGSQAAGIRDQLRHFRATTAFERKHAQAIESAFRNLTHQGYRLYAARVSRLVFGGIIKTIGLIGGMSWASSIEYYRFINQEVNRRLGGQHNAKNLMLTVDFAEIEALQVRADWDQLGAIMADAARKLE